MRKGEPMKMQAGTARKYDAGSKPTPTCPADKTYCYRGRRPDGAQTHQHFRLHSELLAYDRELADAKARAKHGLPTPVADLTFRELVERFFEGYSSPRTERKVRAQLVGPLGVFGSKRASSVSTIELERHLNSLAIGARTKRDYCKAIRQVYAFGVTASLVTHNPAKAVRTQQPPPSDVRPFASWAEVRRVSDAMSDPIDSAIVLFAAATGLRPEEWLALEATDIDRNAHTVRVNKVYVNGQLHRDRGKTDTSFRIVHPPDLAFEALDSIPTPLRGPLFSWKDGDYFPLGTLRRRWTKALRTVAAEIADEQGLTDLAAREQLAAEFHRPLYQLRHTYATLALAARVPVDWISKQLGHTNIQTTVSTYAQHIRPVHEQNRDLLNAYAAQSDSACVRAVSEPAVQQSDSAALAGTFQIHGERS